MVYLKSVENVITLGILMGQEYGVHILHDDRAVSYNCYSVSCI